MALMTEPEQTDATVRAATAETAAEPEQTDATGFDGRPIRGIGAGGGIVGVTVRHVGDAGADAIAAPIDLLRRLRSSTVGGCPPTDGG